jgi:putative lipoprotein involved in iron transport
MIKLNSGSWWRKATAVALAGALVAMPLAGCQSNSPSGSGGSGTSQTASDKSSNNIDVTITDDSCKLTANSAQSGTVTFTVTNKGTAVNEFEILAEDKLQIKTERENITPGTTVTVTAQLEPGTYYTASKTNMVGALVDATKFEVTDSGKEVKISDDEQQLREAAQTNYTSYVKDQSGQLLEATKAFAEAYKKGDYDTCRNTYAIARLHYERIEPTAEAFGDIDPYLDERRADAGDDGYVTDFSSYKLGTNLHEAKYWTGWHAIELDLWTKDSGYTNEFRAALADTLVSDTQSLYDLVYSNDFKVSLDEISNGAISLLEEVATTKITGEEEAFSHTDLYDFQANIEGAKVAYGDVRDLVKMKSPDTADAIDKAFQQMESELAKYNTGTAEKPVYPSYTEIDANAGENQTDDKLSSGARSLSNQINALRESVAQLTSIVLKES